MGVALTAYNFYIISQRRCVLWVSSPYSAVNGICWGKKLACCRAISEVLLPALLMCLPVSTQRCPVLLLLGPHSPYWHLHTPALHSTAVSPSQCWQAQSPCPLSLSDLEGLWAPGLHRASSCQKLRLLSEVFKLFSLSLWCLRAE